MQAGISSHSGPGGWNDLDMLEVGNGGMSDSEYIAHFSMCTVPQFSFSSFASVHLSNTKDFFFRGRCEKSTYIGERYDHVDCQ